MRVTRYFVEYAILPPLVISAPPPATNVPPPKASASMPLVPNMLFVTSVHVSPLDE
jgi:hypothetical protein